VPAVSDSSNTNRQALGEQVVKAAEAQKQASKRQLSMAQRQSQAIAQKITLVKQRQTLL